MRHALVRLTGLLIVLMLVLTGCNLIGVDPIMKLDEDFAKLAKRYSGVVASYDGGEIKQADVMASFTSMYSNYSQMYSMFGYSVPADAVTTVENNVVQQAVQDVAIAKYMDEHDLKLDDEKLAALQAEADEHYQTYYDTFYAGITEKNEAVHAKQTEYNMAVNGFTKDAIQAIEVAEANRELVEQTVRDEIADISEDDLKAAYEAKLKADEDKYTASAGSFETDMSSEDALVAWVPEGYRTVKHILFQLSEEQITALSELNAKLLDVEAGITALNTAETAATASPEATANPDALPEKTIEELNAEKAEIEKQIAAKKDEILASFKEKTDAVYARLEAGEEFDALMAELGEDPGMQSEPSMSSGYYVSAASTVWDTSFRDAAMAIEEVGGVSEPVLSGSGVHIIYYNSDVIPGAVDIETVRDVLTEEALTAKRDEAYVAQYEEWKKGVSIKKYPKVLG